MAKPAERRRELAHHGERRIFGDNTHAAAMNQAPHRVDTISQTHQHKGHANDEGCNGNILKERHEVNTQLGHILHKHHIINFDRCNGRCRVILLNHLHTAERQQCREDNRAEQNDSIKDVECLVAHSNLVDKIQGREAERRLREIY